MSEDATPMMNTPAKIRYSDLVSQAVDGVRTERRYVPNNGNTFSPELVRNIRIPISVPADHFIDTSNSFLKFTITNS